MSRRLLTSAMASLALSTVAVPTLASDTGELGGYRSSRPWESPQNFALELRFGPYRPAIDDDFPQAKPYEAAFGSKSRLYVGLELDWQALRIPYLGTLGPGIGIGYTRMTGHTRLSSTGESSAEKTSLGILPMYAVGVLRVDVLARETVIPLVGYGKAGLGHALWWTGNDLGPSRVDDKIGRGSTSGTHFALGAMLLLDVFEPSSAITLDNDMGINHSYLFFEWMVSNLDGFGAEPGTKMRVGTNTWVAGLAFEM